MQSIDTKSGVRYRYCYGLGKTAWAMTLSWIRRLLMLASIRPEWGPIGIIVIISIIIIT